MPRRFGFFDYEVPSTLTVSAGDVVRIPFRQRDVWGVVTDVLSQTTETRTRMILSKDPTFALNPKHITLLHSIALELGQSVSSVFATAFEGLLQEAPARITAPHNLSSPSIDIPTMETVKALLAYLGTEPACAAAIDDETSIVLAHALCKTSSGQICVVVPRERDATRIATLLSTFAPAVLTGKTSLRSRNTIIRGWRSGALRVLVGTRQAALLSPHALEAVLVYQSGCDDHNAQRRNPYIDSRRAARALAAQYGARYVSCDPFPPVTRTEPIAPIPNEHHDCTVVDVTHHGERTPYSLITQTLLDAIKLALHSQKKVILFLNRKGVAKRLECGACHHVPFCGTCGSLPTVRLHDLLCTSCGTEMWKPTVCPACQSPKIGLRAIGGEKLAAHCAELFPSATIATVAKGSPLQEADITIATEFFWSSVYTPFQSYSFGVVAEVLADIGFTAGSYSGAEDTARRMARLMLFAKRKGATCIIQTVARDRLLTLLGASHAYQQERLAREKYHLPPFGVIVTFTHCALSDLPPTIAARVVAQNNTFVAKIDHETFRSWQQLFPTIPDSVKIHIAQ